MTIAIDADAVGELLLRNLAVTNRGKFSIKKFDGSRKEESTRKDKKWARLLEDFSKQRLTVGGQLKIVGIMRSEEKQREAFWKEEWKCANRLITPVQSKKLSNQSELQDLQKKLAKSVFSVRVGGGYVYQSESEETEMDQIFDVFPKPETQRLKTRQIYPLSAPYDYTVARSQELRRDIFTNTPTIKEKKQPFPSKRNKVPQELPKVPVHFQRRWSF